MFKRLLKSTAVLLALVCSGPLFGQARDYIFSVSTSTYTPLGGTAIPVDILADTRSDTVAIGFDFYFEGQAYDSASVASDGFLSFIVGASSFLTNDLDNGSSIRRPLVAPLWDDHDGRANASAAAYEVSGTAPNRVFTFEWSNWEWRYNSTDSVVSFQVKLYETTNEIEFHYRWECSSCANSPSASIGLSGATSFLSVTGVGTGSPSASSITEDNSIDTIVTDQVFKFTPSTCPSPTLLSFTNVEKDSITVNWTGTGTGPWYIYWGPAGFDQATPGVSLDTSTTTSFIAHGLSHSTEYSFFIKEDCGGGDTSKYAGPFYQTTIYAPPYLETFTNGYPGADYTEAAGLIANPTSFTSTTSSNWKEDGFSNAGTTGAVSLNIFGTSRKEWFFGPSIDLGDGSTIYQFEMDVAVTNWNNATADAMGPDDSVLVVISTDNGATWNKSNTILTLTESNTIPNGAGAHYIASLAGYSGLVKFGVYAQSTQSNTDYDFHVDNIAINPQPPCPLPGMLQSTVYGLDSVIVVWNSTNSNFNVEYGIAPANPGVGTNTVAVTDTFVVLKGLQTGAAYDIYVQTDCSTGAGGTSGFVSASFAVPCIATAPYLENFDGATWKIGTSGGSGDTIDGCWTRNSNTGYKWSVFNGSTLTANTGPDKDHTSGTGNFLFTESSSTSPSLAQLESPYIDISSLTNPYVSFWYHRYGSASSMGDMVLEVNDGTGWDTVLTLTGLVQTSTTNPFVEIGADLSAYTDTVQIRFTAEEKACCTGDMAIDDFKVDEAPSCLPILNLTADGIVDSAATFRWDGTTTATSYEVWFGPQGFYQGTATVGGTKVIAQYDSLLVDTLSDLTCYEFVVRGICGPGDTTAYAGPYSFCTPPSCPQPTALGVDPVSITHNSADVYWTTGGSSDFNIEYGPIGFARGSGTSMNVTNDTVSLSSLASGTGYEFYVRDSCGQGDVSLWSGPFSFVTAFTTNYLQDFSSSTPFAWLEADGRLRANTIFTSSSSSWLNDQFGNVGTNNSQRVNIFTVDQYEWLISPSIYLDPAISNLQMEFDVAVTDYANAAQGYFGTDDSLVVVISTDNGATWSSANAIWYADATDTLDAAGEHVIVPLTGYSGYVRFGVYAGSAINDAPDNDWFIDNFEVRTPRACNSPTGIMVSNITTDSASVDWTPGTTTGLVGASVIYTVGNQPASTGTVVTGTTNPIILSGLMASTDYCVYVVEQCANGYSDTIGPICFTTECVPVSAPFFEDFENFTVGHFDGGESCWNFYSNNPGTTPSGNFSWEVRNSVQTTSTNTGPNGDHTLYPAIGGKWIHADNSGGSSNDSTMFISPIVDISGLANPQLEYWFHNFAAPTSTYRQPLYVDLFDGTTWYYKVHVIDSVFQSSGTDPWKDTIIDLAPYSATGTIQVRFRSQITRSAGGAGDVAIDDVRIWSAGNCVAPTNVVATAGNCDSASVSWTSDAGTTSSTLVYTLKGTGVGAGNIVGSVTSPYALSGLMLNTEYDVYIIDSCAAGFSGAIGPVTFKTDSVGPVHASFTAVQTSATLIDGKVDVDATASTGDGLTYSWDFGNTTNGTGATTQGTYTANGAYSIVLTVTDRCGNTDDTTVVVTVAEISIAENAYNAGIEMYPNPNNGTFKVNVTDGSGAYTIEVIDLSGRVIYHQSNVATGTAHEVQLQNKAKGVYMVRLKGKGLNVTQRIVID